MPKPDKLTRVTAVVALAYLGAIPLTAYLGYRLLQDLQREVDELWRHVEDTEPPERPHIFRRYLLK